MHGASPTGRARHPRLGIEGRDAAVLSRLDGFDAAWKAGLVLFGMHLLVIGWLLLRRSGVFATIVGALVLLAGAGYLADSVLWILVPDGLAVAQFTFIGEIVLIAWLVVGGIRSLRAGRATVDHRMEPDGGPVAADVRPEQAPVLGGERR